MKNVTSIVAITVACLFAGTEAEDRERKLQVSSCPGTNATPRFFRTDDPSKTNGCISAVANPDHFCPRGAATHCPDACGTCDIYSCGDSEAEFLLKDGTRMDCTFNKSSLFEIVRLCRDPQIKSACRHTCYNTKGCAEEPADFISKFGYAPDEEVV